MGVPEEPRRRLVDEYWREYRARQGRSDDYGASGGTAPASDEVDRAVRAGGPAVVELLVALAEAVPDDDLSLAFLGAGPVEDLLRLHANALIDHIDAAARQVPSFWRALQSAWFDTFLLPGQTERLRRFGPPS